MELKVMAARHAGACPALGGTLERETRSGTKLTIQFPLTQPSSNGKHAVNSKDNPQSDRAPRGHRGGQAWFSVRWQLCWKLKRHGCSGPARTGKEALNTVLSQKPDVFITDIEMPEMTGLDVAAELKRRKLGTKVIIVTTFARGRYLRRALRSELSDICYQGCAPEDLPRPCAGESGIARD